MTNTKRTEQPVYISCVDEVRYSFVSHLSDALRREGISVFVDSDDLLSKEAQEKVEGARVCVMVLPGNGRVCLEKLGKVLNSQRDIDQVVVPVLYGDSQWYDEWLDELHLRGFSAVYQSRKECNDSELVEEIVRDVNEKLSHMGRIGIYSKLLEIENMVNKQPLGIRCLGIWGMPGIGKTTLAKAFFDQVSGEFDACCFIEDFDKAIHEKRIYRVVAEQLTLGNGGKLSLRRDKLISKRVLVVLDDVRNPLAAESFLEEFDWFGPESLIIITSRDKRVFRLCQVNHIYEVQGLNEKEALQLFLLCASIKNMREQNLHELSVKVINYAKGNPLAISIYGRELKNKRKVSEMETAFLKLTRRPPLKIVDAFKGSYDTLSDSEKNIFLDIACLFQGENVDDVKQLLEGCGFFPHVGINVLVEKCLVTISENRVQMHNLTRDVGREIVNGETVLIERRNRLWEPWSIKYLLEDKERTTKRAQGTEEIEGMFLDTLNLSFDVKPAAFENMLNLRLLKIYCSSPEIRHRINFREIHSLPNELRLLHWENYPLQFLPEHFDPMNLVEINMPHSQLQKLWGGTKNLEMLKTIRLCHSRKLDCIDDILKAPNLEVVDLQGCIKLKSFPSTGQLLHLRVVNLSGCTKIKEFPEVPPNIETLHLQGTGIRKLPLSAVKSSDRVLANLLAELPGLSDALKLERLTSLVNSNSSSQDLDKLICLELKDCSRLRSLPDMVSLELLTVLDLSGCSKLKTIQGFPRNLKELYLGGTAVGKVPRLPRCLELLNAHGCASLKSIRLDSEHLPMHYTFSNCFNLSPQVISNFLVDVLGNVNRIPRDRLHELNESPAFSFCAPPSHANQVSTLGLKLGSSVMTQLDPSWRNTLVGFAMLMEVEFSEDYYDANGFGISCVCRWINKEGHSRRIERNLHCWSAGQVAPNVQKNHLFVFYDAKMRPSTGEGIDPDILGNLVVFEFFPVNQEMKRLDDSCTVTRCGIYAIKSNTELKMSSPVSSSDPMECSGDQVEEILRVSYDGLEEMDKALFRFIACLLNDENVDSVAPQIASAGVNIDSGLKELASKSLIRVSSNGEIVMDSSLRKMWNEILHSQSMLPSSSKDLTRDVEKVSVASSSSRSWKYDVFRSFSGQDFRKNFLSHLAVEFKRKSIITFEDTKIDKGMPIGPLLVQAIRESRISIVVFSKRYASSSWLLAELVEITKCKEEFGQIVIPIFYDVDPAHVRKQTGEFGRHFKQTSKGKTEDEKQQWQRALMDVANLPGYHSPSWHNEGEMFETILSDVSNMLNHTPSRDFDDLVGIDAHIAKMIPLLHLESDEVKMVGIWGPPGIGKTTIARHLYNKICPTFQCCAFTDHRDVNNKFGESDYSAKMYIQQLVLSEITYVKDLKIPHLGVMQDSLKYKKVLLILDGVNDRLVLDAAAGNSNWFGPGSRIIVITKDLALLKSHGISYIYKVDLPSKKEAIQMLCLYAFGQKYPFDGFMELATEAAEMAGALPLVLRVYGSYLRGMSKKEWSEVLPRLRNRRDGEIESLLKFSYDGLHEEDQALFLHISCLFNHGTVEYLTRLLTSHFMDIKYGLRRLDEKSLIHISEHGNVKMHDLQQKFGREIIRKQCPVNPGKRQFLLDPRDISEVFEENTGTRNVLGISLDMSEIKELLISERGFDGMKNLQFLKFYTNLEDKEVKVRLPHGLAYLPQKLTLLHWEGFPLRCLPPNFIPNHLVELTMEASKLEVLWSGIQPLESLKCMNLRGSLDLREIPDLSHAINLETLDLGGCSSLTKLPYSIGQLHKLKDFDMERCIYMEVLPSGINLESLYYLNLNGCSRLRSFPQLSTSISDLYLDGTSIEEVPGWIENISALTYLSMNGCNKLKKISPNISKLKLLVEVDFSECKALTEESWENHPEEICTSLMIVNMSGNNFERLPDTWISIQPKYLDLGNCRSLVSLPELPTSLSILTANYCESLESIYGCFQQPQMSLQFINCYKLNQQAREFILHSDCAYAILPGGELPAYFTHRVDGNFLTVSLPRISLSRKILSFKACIVVEPRVCWFDFGVIWLFRGGKDNKYFSLSTNIHTKTSHLIIFGFEFSCDGFNDNPAELNYSDVQFEFFGVDHQKEIIKIKECGVQLLELSSSLNGSMKRFKTVNGEMSGDDNAEPSRSRNQMRIT
ncbi:disease resistance protein RRS1-like [Brassica napus]|uniref:disease resistance protein RRS1-like n=1 Tax=Brassica napus TaxID=3708 RepID=UPI0006AA7954|nr:disease resistance protein RRS1-like [Brassica napus]